jgi:hypothetical protein
MHFEGKEIIWPNQPVWKCKMSQKSGIKGYIIFAHYVENIRK